jgi:cell division GTPase FtsZ
MLKDKTTAIGIGLAGETVGLEFQIRNYTSYLMNGSTQDNQTLTGAKNVMALEGYDGLAGDRSLALEALKKNAPILKKLSEIENQIVICIASGGGSTGSGTIPYICDIVSKPSNIVVAILLMPRPDEPIQKRLNAYNAAKELMDTESIGAIIFVDNAAYPELKKVNAMLVNMLDAFLTDTSSSSGSNFDDSEKMKMLKEHGAFVLAMLSDNKNGKTTSQDMINSMTAKNIFLPINNDGVVGNIGIINQKGNKIDEHELIKAIGTPENVFIGNNGKVNIACASGLGYPVEYITKLGKSAVEEQKKRMEKRESLSTLDDLGIDDIEVPEIPKKKTPGKRKQITWDFINSL